MTSELPDGPRLSAADTTFRWFARPYAFLEECAAAYGDTFTLRFTRFGTHVVIAHPDDVRDVLSGDPDVLHAGRGNALLEPVLGRHSLLVMDGDRHLAERALLQPIFRNDRLPRYAALVAEATRRWTAAWNGGGTLSVQRTAIGISREVILRAALGPSEDELARLSGLIDHVMVLVGTNATFDGQSTDGRLRERFLSARSALDAALQAHLDRRRREPAAGEDDVLSLVLAARGPSGEALSDEAIRDELLTLIMAGHETTASSITWALLLLHAAPEALARVLGELDQATGVDGERLAGLRYLQAVCLETLRMRPVIPVVSRELQRPFRVGGKTLPAGVFVTPCAYLAHRREESFPQPDSFRPERFVAQRPSPYVFFPFGGGVRRCIGMSFALLEMQIVLGMLLRGFRFAPVDGAPPRATRRGVTIIASGGAKMFVEPR